MKSVTTKIQSYAGFTIVELLIVIVVIAILATISIIAYNGIQTRSLNTRTESAVSEYRKMLIAYATEKGAYPNASNSSCLGEASDYPDSTCYEASGYNATFMSQLKAWTGSNAVPSPSTECLPMYTGCRRSLAFSRSAFLLDGATHTYWLIYLLKGNAKCTAPGLSGGTWINPTSTPNVNGWTEQNSGTSLCRVVMPDPAKL